MNSICLFQFWIFIPFCIIQFKVSSNDINLECDKVKRIFRHLNEGKRGIPELEIPDPIPIPDFNVEKASEVNATFKNSSVYGISDFIISRIYLDLVEPKLDIELIFPHLNVQGDYTLLATQYFFTVHGAGPFWMNITQVYVSCMVELISDEKGRFVISDVRVDFDIKELKLHFENLGAWQKLSNTIINALSSTILNNIKPTVISEAKEKIISKGNAFFATLPPQNFLFSPLFPIDVALLEICDQMRTLGFDPKHLDNLNWSFEKSILFVKFYGSVKLFDGYVKGLSTLHRSGDVDVLFTNGSLQLRVRLGFDDLEAGYKMAVEFQGLEKMAGVHFQVESVDVELIVTLDDESLPVTVKELNLIDVRQVTTDVDGLGSLDFILEFVTNSFVNVFKYQLSKLLETDISYLIQERMNSVTLNNTCHSIL